MKPPSFLTLIKGRAIGAFSGFVAMFNWMEKFLYYLRSKTGTIAITDPYNDNHYSLDLAGYKDAKPDSIPVKSSSGAGAFEWKKLSGNLQDNGAINIVGFTLASNDTVLTKNSSGVLEWKALSSIAGKMKIIDESGTEVECAGFKIASASDTNLTVTTSKDASNIVTFTIGVYYC